MAEDKLILNNGEYELNIKTREITVSCNVLNKYGWTLSDKSVIEEIFNSNPYLKDDFDKQADYLNQIIQVYFNGNYTIKANKYYIRSDYSY